MKNDLYNEKNFNDPKIQEMADELLEFTKLYPLEQKLNQISEDISNLELFLKDQGLFYLDDVEIYCEDTFYLIYGYHIANKKMPKEIIVKYLPTNEYECEPIYKAFKEAKYQVRIKLYKYLPKLLQEILLQAEKFQHGESLTDL